MNKIPIIFSFFILLSLFSCRKEVEPEVIWNQLNQDYYDYCDFPVGSYWIYEDSVSGKIDSLYLESKSQRLKDDTKCLYKETDFCYMYEWSYDYYFSSLQNKEYVYGYGRAVQGGGDHNIYHSPMTLRDCFSSPLKVGIGTPLLIEVDKDMFIDSTDFHEVIVYQEKFYEGSVYIYYLAKNIGLIKYHAFRVEENGTSFAVWRLKKYHINN